MDYAVFAAKCAVWCFAVFAALNTPFQLLSLWRDQLGAITKRGVLGKLAYHSHLFKQHIAEKLYLQPDTWLSDPAAHLMLRAMLMLVITSALVWGVNINYAWGYLLAAMFETIGGLVTVNEIRKIMRTLRNIHFGYGARF
jgi:hypothetical protein